MVFNTTFNKISVLFWWRKPEYQEKTTDKLYHIDLDKTETAHVMKHVKGNKVV
jgi:hypothetical protein